MRLLVGCVAGHGGGRAYGHTHGSSDVNRDSSNDENSFTAPVGQGAFEGETGKPLERLGYGGPCKGVGRGN